MASTGTAVFSLTRDQLIAEMYRKIRVVYEGATPSATQVTDAASRLNMIIKNCMSDGLQLWVYNQVVVPMVASQQSYTIGPSGANVTADRPLRVLENGNYARSTVGSHTYDTPLRLLSRQEYLQVGNKTATGVVNGIYYDSKIDLSGLLTTSPGTGWGTLFVFPAPVDATYTLYLNVQRPIYDMNAAGDEFDFPSEWFMYLLYALSSEMADDNEVDESRIARLEARTHAIREKLFDWSVETASTNFAPDSFSSRSW